MSVLQPQVIQQLADRPFRDDSPVLSVYLNLDPGDFLHRRGGYKVTLDGMLRDIESHLSDEDKRRHFREDADWIVQKVEFHIPKGKSLLLFCDVSESFFLVEDLPIHLASQACYEPAPFIRPILEARAEYERYGIVVLDRERARFFVITMGTIEEVSDVFQTPPFKVRSTSGRDQLRSSQTVAQRRAAVWSGWFLKDVSDLLQELIQKYDIDQVLLAGPEDVTAELQRVLPKAIAARVVERVRMALGAKPNEVLDLVLPIIERMEKSRELAVIDDLVTIARKANPTLQKAVVGLNPTLDAVNQGRVYRLAYCSGLKTNGFHCTSCGVLLDQCTADCKCPYCSQPLRATEDLMWLASERVLEMGGKIDEIKGEEACAKLNGGGGIGAFLR
ncbi:MAG: hypothetical protein GX443_05375 [Deltaproteobacteria bacterium]|nr:hypothetical protein [Deltaproteobacteria bacterium]